ncbi:MAG: hypothetical protein HZA91_00150 [Verrucomicrobia bacterium]|nr:hypothetical protein [Verrucomicrobiota bacterium]
MDEVIRLFNEHHVRYLLIGGQAVRLEGMPRFSMDWDFYIPAGDTANIVRINQLLADELDVPLSPLGPRGEGFVQTFQTRWGIIQFHLSGTGLPPFNEAEQRSVSRQTEDGTPVRCLSGPDLLASKRAIGRPQDLLDAEFLERKQSLGLL